MFELPQRVLKDITTTANGQDYDVGRVLGILGVLTFLGLSIANWAKFDPQTFGVGFAAVIAGMGAALALQHKTEPKE